MPLLMPQAQCVGAMVEPRRGRRFRPIGEIRSPSSWRLRRPFNPPRGFGGPRGRGRRGSERGADRRMDRCAGLHTAPGHQTLRPRVRRFSESGSTVAPRSLPQTVASPTAADVDHSLDLPMRCFGLSEQALPLRPRHVVRRSDYSATGDSLSQFRRSRPSTRVNSRSLLVTSVQFSARAWAAIRRSLPPMGVPFSSSCTLTTP